MTDTTQPVMPEALSYVPCPSERLLGERYDDVYDEVMQGLADAERVCPLSRETVVMMTIDFSLAAAERLGCIEAALAPDGPDQGGA